MVILLHMLEMFLLGIVVGWFARGFIKDTQKILVDNARRSEWIKRNGDE